MGDSPDSLRTFPNTRRGCPICGRKPGEKLLELSFPQKLGLPETISLVECAACDFAYIIPANQEKYNEYYQRIQNDLIHQEIASASNREKTDNAYDAQAKRLRIALKKNSALNVLDYGCGSGGLLRTLLKAYPHHNYYGFDLNAGARRTTQSSPQKGRGGKIKFIDPRIQNIEFDLVIFSHVLEHLVDLDSFHEVVRLLKPGGGVYIEVPNAFEYKNYPRREYLYNIDRLHINHFSERSLRSLTDRSGLIHVRTASNTFLYKDGGLYPAIYTFARRPVAVKSALKRSLKRYIRDEQVNKAAPLSHNEKKAVIVYGFGDNFFRARSTGGPLSKVPILAVVDKRAKELRRSKYGSKFNFMNIEDAVKKYPDAPVVVTVSWNVSSIIENVKSLTNAPTFSV